MKRIVLLAAIAVVAGIVFFIACSSLTPLFIGIAFAYIFNPAVQLLEKRGVKRSSALFFIYLIVVILIFAIFWIGVPYLISAIMALQKTISDYFGSLSINLPESFDGILSQFGSTIIKYIGNAASALVSTINVIINVVLGLVISFYIILDREKIVSSLMGLIPKGWRTFVSRLTHNIDIVLQQFLTGQLGVALAISCLAFIGLLLLRIKYAFLLAIIAGILDIIPFFGPILGAVPAVLIAAAQSPQKAIWTAVLFIAVQQIEGAYISPKILSDYVGLHPIITIMAVIVGGNLFGIAGMLLAIPACGIIRSVANEIIDMISENN